MTLDEYEEPKGAYYNPALVAVFDTPEAAEAAIKRLRHDGFTERDIQVAHRHGVITIVVSEPTPGMLEEARAILRDSNASTVHPYGSTDRF